MNSTIWWAFGDNILGLSWKKWPHCSQNGQKQPNLGTLFIKFLHVESRKLYDSKTYSTQFFMYFQPMITIFPKKNYLTMLKFGLMLITTLALWISILHNIFLCSILFRISNSFILQQESCDLVQFWARYSQKTHISILLVVTSTQR